jgi:glycosyltransferase involved in cell wall biosynthesis
VPRPKVLFLVTEDWYFWSHRLALAQTLLEAGFEVVVACRVREHGDRIAAAGFTLVPLRWRRRGDAILGGLLALAEIVRLYRRTRPLIVHHVALKPVVFGSLAALVAGVQHQVNLIAGLGFVFVSANLLARLQRLAIVLALRFLANRRGSRVIVQNEDDREELLRRNIFDPERIHLVRGSGVNLAWFKPLPEPPGVVTGAVVCRMLRYKGVGTAVDAVRILRQRGIPFRLLLAGPTDPDNPSSHGEAELRQWQREGLVEWLGPVEDVRTVWARAHIALFPSMYREGVPKALLEAAACARPIITTNTPGCRDVVQHGENGLVVDQDSAEALADAIARLATDAALRQRMGANGRRHAALGFSEEIVTKGTLAVYARFPAVRSRLSDAGEILPQREAAPS